MAETRSEAEGQVLADSQAVALLAARYGPALRAYLQRRLPDSQLVEDLSQEVFTALLRRSELDTIDNAGGYIFRIAANLLNERVRRAHRRPDLIFEGGADPAGSLVDMLSPERVALGREAYQLMLQTLQELPERMRTIFILNRFEDLSGREIALRLGISISLVEKTMHRVIKILEERLS